ncbi:MAG: SDR family oxidoreductase [Pirellulaceae bacterium]
MKTIVITGTTQGLGLETAKCCLAAGHQVLAINRRTTPELEQLKAAFDSTLRMVTLDLANSSELTSDHLNQIAELNVPIDGLVNNAAIAYDDLVTNLRHEDLEAMYRVNVFAPMMLTRWAIRNMLLHERAGSIIHVSSVSTYTGYKGLAMYASTKGAIEAFSKNVAREWGSRNIRSNCVVPGFMETTMSAGLDSEAKNKIYRRTSLQQPTSLSSVAQTICFLLSDASGSITGQNVVVDSGTI